MAERVVNVLETVEIQEHQCQMSVTTLNHHWCAVTSSVSAGVSEGVTKAAMVKIVHTALLNNTTVDMPTPIYKSKSCRLHCGQPAYGRVALSLRLKISMTCKYNLWAIGYVRSRTDLFRSCVYLMHRQGFNGICSGLTRYRVLQLKF